MAKLLSGAPLKAAICACVVFLSAANIALAVASVATMVTLLAIFASLTNLLYAVIARAVNRPITVKTTTISVMVKPARDKDPTRPRFGMSGLATVLDRQVNRSLIILNYL